MNAGAHSRLIESRDRSRIDEPPLQPRQRENCCRCIFRLVYSVALPSLLKNPGYGAAAAALSQISLFARRLATDELLFLGSLFRFYGILSLSYVFLFNKQDTRTPISLYPPLQQVKRKSAPIKKNRYTPGEARKKVARSPHANPLSLLENELYF